MREPGGGGRAGRGTEEERLVLEREEVGVRCAVGPSAESDWREHTRKAAESAQVIKV